MSNIVYVAGAIFLIVLMALGFDAAIEGMSNNYEQFMHQCLHDHKKYECQALWDGGGTSVVVIPVR